MDYKLQIIYSVFFVSILIFLVLNFNTEIISQEYPVRSGSIIFLEKKCNNCHSVKSQEIECLDSLNNSVVDLSKVGDSLESEIIKDYLKKKIKIENKKHPVSFNGTSSDLDILSKWLHNLSSVVY